MPDREENSLPRRVARYARVGAGVGGAAARIGAARLFGRELSDPKNAADLVATLGGLKGPLMKVAQMMATVPDLMPLYGTILAGSEHVRVPEPIAELSTGRLLTMTWLEGNRLLDHRQAPLAERNRIAAALFEAWWQPFARYGVIHGDPHLGNYTVFEEGGRPAGINLLDYGCIRIFPLRFVGGVVDLYHGLLKGDADLVAHAYRTWGFKRLTRELMSALNIWARFIY